VFPQESTTEPYPVPVESISHSHTLFRELL